jgi:hypothetical protein
MNATATHAITPDEAAEMFRLATTSATKWAFLDGVATMCDQHPKLSQREVVDMIGDTATFIAMHGHHPDLAARLAPLPLDLRLARGEPGEEAFQRRDLLPLIGERLRQQLVHRVLRVPPEPREEPPAPVEPGLVRREERLFESLGKRIRDGELAEGVREATVASTLLRLLADIVAVGADTEVLPGGVTCPTLVIGDVALSGR